MAVELLSPSTENEDLGKTLREVSQPPTKWVVYEQILRIPFYVVFSRYTDEVHFFELAGDHYREVNAENRRLWLPKAGLGIGLWFGEYQGVERQWLRFYDADGECVFTPLEQARKRTERLAAQLKAAGIEPER